MAIEELSRRTGMTVRNLRELQTRGLLDPPTLAGRKGLYGEPHLARVALIRRLQDRGYSLASIGDLLASWAAGGGALGTLEQAVVTPAAGPQRAMGRDELLGVLPELARDATLLAQAREVGFVCGEGPSLRAPSAELAHIGRAFIDGGVPLSALFAELTVLRADAERIAARFRDMFQQHVVAELQRQAMPADMMPDLAARIAKLRPLGVRATAIVLGAVIERGGPAPQSAALVSAGKTPKAAGGRAHKRRS